LLLVWLSPKAVDNPATNLLHYPASYDNCWREVKLTTNWPTFLQDNFNLPDAVDWLEIVFGDKQSNFKAVIQE